MQAQLGIYLHQVSAGSQLLIGASSRPHISVDAAKQVLGLGNSLPYPVLCQVSAYTQGPLGHPTGAANTYHLPAVGH